MDLQEKYLREYKELKADFELEKYKLRKKYTSEMARFKVGDFVGNVTGIIKIDNVTCDVHKDGTLSVVYTGLRYKKIKGKLERTKSCWKTGLQDISVKLIS